nr:hypothetical protein [Synechococcus sp. BIOS-E4-1]
MAKGAGFMISTDNSMKAGSASDKDLESTAGVDAWHA